MLASIVTGLQPGDFKPSLENLETLVFSLMVDKGLNSHLPGSYTSGMI